MTEQPYSSWHVRVHLQQHQQVTISEIAQLSLNSIRALAEAESALDSGVHPFVCHDLFTTSKRHLRPIPVKPNLVGMTI